MDTTTKKNMHLAKDLHPCFCDLYQQSSKILVLLTVALLGANVECVF